MKVWVPPTARKRKPGHSLSLMSFRSAPIQPWFASRQQKRKKKKKNRASARAAIVTFKGSAGMHEDQRGRTRIVPARVMSCWQKLALQSSRGTSAGVDHGPASAGAVAMNVSLVVDPTSLEHAPGVVAPSLHLHGGIPLLPPSRCRAKYLGGPMIVGHAGSVSVRARHPRHPQVNCSASDRVQSLHHPAHIERVLLT